MRTDTSLDPRVGGAPFDGRSQYERGLPEGGEVEVCASTAPSLSSLACGLSSCTSIAPESEIRIESQRGFDFGLRFIESAVFRESGSEIETPSGVISVQLTSKPVSR
jgi:hypothetical protein